MKRLLVLLVVSWTCACAATTYYVSSSAGNDSNDGMSPATAWSTLASVSAGGAHAALIVPGTTVLLARGDVWREQLTPAASGTSGNPIVFDAYGTGAAPEITGNQPLGPWTLVSGNTWSAPVTASGMTWVLFGTIWGTKQTSPGALQHDRDFYFSGTLLYVYAPTNPATYYGTVAAMLMANVPLISVNGKQWLTFQHLNFLQKLLQGIAFVPTIVNSIEGLFGTHSGEQKKESAISFVAAALQLTESVANREIVDEVKFKDGLSKIIDGTVECLNASSWSHVDVRK